MDTREIEHGERVVTLVTDGTAGFDVRDAYADHGGEIFGFVLNGVGDRGAAEDCVQEVFIRAWRARSRFDADRGSRRTWLYSIARNVVVDHHRARARRPQPVADDDLAAIGPPTAAPSAAVEERMVLYDGLSRLSAEHREVIVAVQIDGMDYQQLSRRTGIAVPTLRTRMYYGLRALRAILGEEDQDA